MFKDTSKAHTQDKLNIWKSLTQQAHTVEVLSRLLLIGSKCKGEKISSIKLQQASFSFSWLSWFLFGVVGAKGSRCERRGRWRRRWRRAKREAVVIDVHPVIIWEANRKWSNRFSDLMFKSCFEIWPTLLVLNGQLLGGYDGRLVMTFKETTPLIKEKQV